MQSAKRLSRSLLWGLGWIFLGIGGLSFWVGGRALHEFWHVDRLLGELIGIGIAVVCAAVGYLLQQASKSDEKTD